MNKIRFSLIALIVALFPCLAIPAPDGDPTEILIIEGGKDTGGSGYHAPALIPITAAYYAAFSSLVLDFRFDLGLVTVSLENQTTGSTSLSVINALQGPQLLPISGDAGLYEITFTLSDGHEYIGSFEIE
ncbi:MAG: hypothetical protein II560_08165 [Bacteroidales bacterium]|nr:hypothetical protein [Bacteroidales bacterium]